MKDNTPYKKQEIAETVLDYWYTLEFLSQDALPRLSYEERRKNSEAAKAASAGKAAAKVLKLMTAVGKDADILELARSEAKRHGMSCCGNLSVYVGRIGREQCIQAIARRLHEEDGRPEVSNDEIACFSIQLNPSGGYIEKTFSLSPMIWAISHLEKAEGKSLAQCLSHQAYREDIETYDRQMKSWGGDAEAPVGSEPVGSESDGSEPVRSAPDGSEPVGSEPDGSAPDAEVRSGAVTSGQIASIYREIYDRYMKGSLETDRECSCMIVYQVFKDEDGRETYEDDDYPGLGRNFFAEDLKLVLSGLQTGSFDNSHPMLKSLISYITGPYGDFYPEEKLLSFEGRSDLEHPEAGDTKGEKLRETLAGILDVQNAPEGKWPSRFMPALMQQTAVNLAVSERPDGGQIFSVNGPPGTGKTTLLKEIIADHIIRKAVYLSEYEKPDEAFEERSFLHGEKGGNGYARWYPKYYRLKDERINDCSILVTSCNNGAVENITKELPLEKGITGALAALKTDSRLCREQLEEVKTLFTAASSDRYEELYCNDKARKGMYQDIYFTEYARDLLGGEEAWGLISAALGRKSNIHKFYQNVLSHLDGDFYRNEKVEARLEQYKRIRKEFREQRTKVEKMREELADHCRDEASVRHLCVESKERIRRLSQDTEQKTIAANECTRQADKLGMQAEGLRAELEEKEREAKLAGGKAEKSREAYARADREYEEKLKSSIDTRKSIHTFKLFHRSDTKAKNELADKYAREAQDLRQKADEMRGLMETDQAVFYRLEEEAKGLRRKTAEWNERLETLGKESEGLKRAIEKNHYEKVCCEQRLKEERERYAGRLKARLETADDVGRFVPLDDDFMEHFLSMDEKESTWAQVSNPWFTDGYNREREKLFFLALQVSKAFILSSKCCFRNYRNLALLWQETREDNETVSFHQEDREACFGPLLQTLFLLVPVISTTFASVGNFLRDIKEPNVLGTLIVDEAGQAPPQMAVGALYRSRRAVIVGDPKQVEPVVTDDLQLLKKAYKENVYKPYKAKNVSVQQLADLINPYGTYMENDKNEKEWLGCPLVVHRRCISPMYDISNQISYSNTMKQQTGAPSKEKEELFCFGGSQWINVKGREKGNKNHFVEAQARRAAQILETAFSRSDDPSLFIITPFTTVKSGMIQYLEGRLKTSDGSVLYEKRGSVKGWMYDHIGTVHTFQGKEANEVIFLLGCDEGREAAGAVRWVNANIVNVAVTRAKYRLYVIGDEKAWKESVYIRRAKSIIDLYAIKELSGILNGGGEESREEKRKRALALCRQLPTAEFVSMEEAEDEAGGAEYIFDPEIYLGELKSAGLLLNELTDEQLEGYGFTRKSFMGLNPQVKENVEWGIKLYSMFKKLRQQYGISGMDASCCGILFCKAIELQVKECFWEGFKRQFPEYRIKGPGKGLIPFRDVDKKDLTLGTFCYALHDSANRQKLAEFMAGMRRGQYDRFWWNQFDIKLDECRKLRNDCCHCDEFTWGQMNRLLVLLFLRSRETGEVVMDGLVRDSEAVRSLLSST